MFCCKYRIYRNILRLLYVDLVQLYRVSYCCITETIGNLETLTVEEVRRASDVCQDFIKLTENVRAQVGAMVSQLKESLPADIIYFNVCPEQKAYIYRQPRTW